MVVQRIKIPESRPQSSSTKIATTGSVQVTPNDAGLQVATSKKAKPVSAAHRRHKQPSDSESSNGSGEDNPMADSSMPCVDKDEELDCNESEKDEGEYPKRAFVFWSAFLILKLINFTLIVK
jgi:hypothetical protein